MLTINNTLDGYLKNVEIKGNTIQGTNLADIRSVGDKVEGQDLYEIPLLCTGENRFDSTKIIKDHYIDNKGDCIIYKDWFATDYIRVCKGDILYANNASEVRSPFSTMYSGYYTLDKKFIEPIFKTEEYGVFTFTCKHDGYIRFSGITDKLTDYIYISTLNKYEPYKSHELTISSPCQLEKGDVLKEVDGVWGIEKNIITINPNDAIDWIINQGMMTDTCVRFRIRNNPYPTIKNAWTISTHFNFILDSSGYNVEGVGASSYDNYGVMVWISKDKLTSLNSEGFNKWRIENNFTIKFATTTPTFIPLPHSQQIILRTFAPKTNILSLTKNGVEPKVKGQVAKSKDAVINTHTEQIDNIHQELERVKKLEESTVSIVRNEGKDFVSVEATNQGYFDDVELKGKTLVSKYSVLDAMIESNRLRVNTDKSKINWGAGKYTIVNLTGKKVFADISKISDNGYVRSISFNALSVIELNQDEYIRCLFGNSTDGFELTQSLLDSFKKSFVILENDHAQNPPTQYFEGLASVGEGTDEIVVSSVWGEGNLFDINTMTNKWSDIAGKGYLTRNGNLVTVVGTREADKEFVTSANPNSILSYVYLEKGVPYTFSYESDAPSGADVGSDTTEMYWMLNGETGTYINIRNNKAWICTKSGKYYPRFDVNKGDTTHKFWNIQVTKGKIVKPYTPHKTDKKRLLRFNPTTQAWEKPILREWDIVEKRDGKYWNRERSGQVVLDGSESISSNGTNDTISSFVFNTVIGSSNVNNVISNKFNSGTSFEEHVRLSLSTGKLIITVLNSRLTSPTIEGFKELLKKWSDEGNPCTVAYQTATEKVYECTNIDLITYPNTTNLTVKSGVLVPSITAKYHGTIMNVLNTLMKKVSVLENDYKNYKTVQNRIQLNSTYSADRVTFRVDTAYASATRIVSLDNDLFMLMKSVVSVGKDNYDRVEIESMLDFYVEIGKFDYEMWDVIWILMEIQHNPPVEETPEI